MTNIITIGTPYIAHIDEKVRLCSKVKKPSGEIELYYEFPAEYEKYLCTERSDSFVLGILEYAMYMGFDIKCEAPMSEALHYQLCNYGMNIISGNFDRIKRITIDSPYTNEEIKSENAVGTGFSAGVDSFYTVLKHLQPNESAFKLTHLLIANIGAFTYASTEKTEKLFYQQVENLMPAEKELGLPLIAINTNYNDFYLDANVTIEYQDYIMAGTPLKIASCVFALQKLFSVYYIASGVQLNLFAFLKNDPNFALLYYTKLLSVPNLIFYGSGTEVNRIQKVEYISKNRIVQKYLSVDAGKNCSHCNKCLRTMFELYSLNKLKEFDSIFDVDDFNKHLSSRIGEYMAIKSERFDGFLQETLQMCKENKVRIPITAYVKSYLFYKPFNFIKCKLRKSRVVRKLYYKFDLDVKFHGEESKVWRDSYLANESMTEKK